MKVLLDYNKLLSIVENEVIELIIDTIEAQSATHQELQLNDKSHSISFIKG